MAAFMSITAICSLLLSSAVYALPQATTSSAAQPSPSAEGNASTNAWVVLTGYEGCDPTQSNFIKASFDEMNNKLMAGEFASGEEPELRYKDIDWKSAAAIEFFGPGYNLDAGKRQGVYDNLNTLTQFSRGFLLGTRIHVRCDDPKLVCPCGLEDGGIAYVSHDNDQYFDHVNFCPRFFTLPKLDDAVNTASSDPANRDIMDSYSNRAQTMAHEMLHLSKFGQHVGSDTIDIGWMYDQLIVLRGTGTAYYAYRSIDTKYLALSDGSVIDTAINNNQNYAHYAMAQYIIKQKGFYPSGSVWHSNDNPPNPPTAVLQIPPGTQNNDIYKLAALDELYPAGCTPGAQNATSATSSVPLSSVAASTVAASSAAATAA